MTKEESLKHWADLPEGQNPLAHMTPIEYKAKGSRYGACGVRIDGNPAFIDAVLSCLKPLLDGENTATRLELARHEVMPTEINGQSKHFENSDRAAEVCYIRLHMRGSEAAHVLAYFDKSLASATERFAKAKWIAS